MNNLDKNDYDLIEAFENAAKILAPHHDEMHSINTDEFIRGGLDLSDLNDYFRMNHTEFHEGMAQIIGATLELSINLGKKA